jgi:stage V sporulation protein G
MEITQVRVFPVEDGKLKAFVSIVIDDCFVVSDIKIIDGTSGFFISMPSKKSRSGTFRDIAHPLNTETRRMLEERIIDEYNLTVTPEGLDLLTVRELDNVDGLDNADDDDREDAHRSTLRLVDVERVEVEDPVQP